MDANELRRLFEEGLRRLDPDAEADKTFARSNVQHNERIERLLKSIQQKQTAEAIAMLRASPELVNACDSQGSSLLHFASDRCEVEIVQTIVTLGGDLLIKDGYGQTPLHWAACSEVVTVLARNGADIEAQDPSGWTPLHATARDGHVSAVEQLIACGANVNAKTFASARLAQSGWTPLMFAAKKGKESVIIVLLAGGADVKIQANDGRNASELAATPAIKLMLEQTAS